MESYSVIDIFEVGSNTQLFLQKDRTHSGIFLKWDVFPCQSLPLVAAVDGQCPLFPHAVRARMRSFQIVRNL